METGRRGPSIAVRSTHPRTENSSRTERAARSDDDTTKGNRVGGRTYKDWQAAGQQAARPDQEDGGRADGLPVSSRLSQRTFGPEMAKKAYFLRSPLGFISAIGDKIHRAENTVAINLRSRKLQKKITYRKVRATLFCYGKPFFTDR